MMQTMGEIKLWNMLNLGLGRNGNDVNVHLTVIRIFLFCLIFKCQMIFKGYLRYKTIASQNVSSYAQIKNFFVSWKCFVSFSRYSSFCIFNHFMIYQICDIMMSISTWERIHFWLYLLNHNSLSHQTWPNGRYKQGK